MKKKNKPEKNKPVIEVKNVSKTFVKYTQNHQKIFRELFNRGTGEIVEVLKDVSFEINKGEKVVLIGELESGRSTLQHLIAGLLQPDSGTIKVRGKITTIFSHRMIFDPTFTGKDNLYLRAGLMGWPKEKIDKRYKDIVEFADLTDIIDQPMSTYKSGAPTRLGFTLETEEKPEVLLFDETFTLGGPAYFEKCISRLEDLINDEDTTMLMVHTNFAVTERLCTRALILKDGAIAFDGSVDAAMRFYRRYCKDRTRKKDEENDLSDIMAEDLLEEAYAENAGSGMGDF